MHSRVPSSGRWYEPREYQRVGSLNKVLSSCLPLQGEVAVDLSTDGEVVIEFLTF